MPRPAGGVADLVVTRSSRRDAARPVHLAAAGVAVGVGILVAAIVAVGGDVALGVLLGCIVAALTGAAAWLGVVRPRLAGAEDRVLALVGPARQVGEQPHGDVGDARLANLVEGLAPGAGLARPRCFVVDDPAANALAAGRDPRHGCLIVTSGLLHDLSRMELEGVVATCLVRIRDGVVAAPTVALAFGRGARVPLLVERAGGALPSDLAAVSLTRYPPGLAAALRRVAPTGGVAPAQASHLLAPLWWVPPGSTVEVEARIEALEEL